MKFVTTGEDIGQIMILLIALEFKHPIVKVVALGIAYWLVRDRGARRSASEGHSSLR